jgi:hypothetical protein
MLNTIFSILVMTLIGFTSSENPAVKDPVKGKSTTGSSLYDVLYSDSLITLPSSDVFTLALRGYENLKKAGLKKDFLSIIDFSIPSTAKRLWIIDVENKKVLFHELVAHGRNTGDNIAGKFSNIPNSNMSSLGFYLTGETYTGRHGLSLYLDGMDSEFNNNARARAIVIHGADYVSEDFIKTNGRLGRSFGCPALSTESYKTIIETISNGSCLFIYYPDEEYLQKSTLLNQVEFAAQPK